MTALKEFTSIFVTGLQIDTGNLISETLIKNYLSQRRLPIPTCAFWQSEIYRANPALKALADRYILELGQVRKLLKVFSPQVILYEINARGWLTLIYMNKEERKEFIYALFLEQVKLAKTLSNKGALEPQEIKDFDGIKSFTSPLAKGKIVL